MGQSETMLTRGLNFGGHGMGVKFEGDTAFVQVMSANSALWGINEILNS